MSGRLSDMPPPAAVLDAQRRRMGQLLFASLWVSALGRPSMRFRVWLHTTTPFEGLGAVAPALWPGYVQAAAFRRPAPPEPTAATVDLWSTP